MKNTLIEKFKLNCHNFWSNGNQYVGGWDTDKLDSPDEEYTLIRVWFDGEKYLIKKWVALNTFEDYEITKDEFLELQKIYFNKNLTKLKK